MPSPEKSYSTEGYRVFTKGPVPEIEEDLSERSRRDPLRTRRLQESAKPVRKRLKFRPIRTKLCSHRCFL